MNSKTKKIFLALTIIVPFLAYCVFYYMPILRNAPFKSSEFESFQFKWGVGKELDNVYDSATGAYQYVNNQDSIVKTKVKLRKNDMIYLHRKANELGLWNFPDVIANKGSDLQSPTVLRYEIQFNYKKKSKKVIYQADYSEIPKLRDVAAQMTKLISQSINDADERYSNK
jgi:hypothetical protein